MCNIISTRRGRPTPLLHYTTTSSLNIHDTTRHDTDTTRSHCNTYTHTHSCTNTGTTGTALLPHYSLTTHSHSHSVTHSVVHTVTHSHTHTITQSHNHSVTQSLSPTVSHTITQSHSQSLAHSLARSLTEEAVARERHLLRRGLYARHDVRAARLLLGLQLLLQGEGERVHARLGDGRQHRTGLEGRSE